MSDRRSDSNAPELRGQFQISERRGRLSDRRKHQGNSRLIYMDVRNVWGYLNAQWHRFS